MIILAYIRVPIATEMSVNTWYAKFLFYDCTHARSYRPAIRCDDCSIVHFYNIYPVLLYTALPLYILLLIYYYLRYCYVPFYNSLFISKPTANKSHS